MLKLIPKLISIILLSISLYACDFRPKHKVIEYQEEVKLSDGSFIWVDIKRHYGWSGYAPGMGSGAYLPGIVEISWDTGFPNVGRQSVFFQDYIAILNKYNGNWYVAGEKNTYSDTKIKNSVNCNEFGILINSRCIIAINPKGEFFKPDTNDIYHIINRNIIYPVQLKDWEDVPEPLHDSKLSWNDKVHLDQNQSERFNGLQKPFFIGENQ